MAMVAPLLKTALQLFHAGWYNIMINANAIPSNIAVFLPLMVKNVYQARLICA